LRQVTPHWWHARISVKAIHGQDLRNAAFFDWHVEGIKGTNGLANLRPNDEFGFSESETEIWNVPRRCSLLYNSSFNVKIVPC
jgi:prepilin-type processing-associated H-X9-DG protein